MSKITKAEVEKLYDDNITKKEYDQIISRIDNRFAEIITTIKPELKTRGWFDYGNCDYESEESVGFFDTHCYRNKINVGGEWAELPEPFVDYIPTRWLWEDFEKEFNLAVENFKIKEQKKKEKQKQDKRKKEKEKLIEAIKSKLTKEELEVVKFK